MLECELLDQRRLASQADARMACFNFIDGWYNPMRLPIGQCPPNRRLSHAPRPCCARQGAVQRGTCHAGVAASAGGAAGSTSCSIY